MGLGSQRHTRATTKKFPHLKQKLSIDFIRSIQSFPIGWPFLTASLRAAGSSIYHRGHLRSFLCCTQLALSSADALHTRRCFAQLVLLSTDALHRWFCHPHILACSADAPMLCIASSASRGSSRGSSRRYSSTFWFCADANPSIRPEQRQVLLLHTPAT